MTTATLTPKQQRFVEEYLRDLNATQAAIRAGYSEKTAKVIAAQNLSKLNIQAAITKGRKQQSERTQITTDIVLAGLLTEAQGRGADTTPTARVTAWAHLGKHLGLFKEKVDLNVSQDEVYVELLALAKARLEQGK